MKHRLRSTAITLAALLTVSGIAFGAAPANAAAPVKTGDYVPGLELPTKEVAPQAAVKKYTRMALGAGTLPVSTDLTQYAVAPGDQGVNGSCITWAIAHTMMGWWANKAGTPTEFAPMYLYSQVHIDNSADGGGSYAADSYAITASQGVDTAAHYTQGAYNFTTKPTAAEIANAAQYKTTTATTLFSSASNPAGSAGITAIKQALANGTPVGIGLFVYGGFEYLNSSDYTWHESDNGALEGGHYVTALGYNSTGLLIENSWGSDWGNKGYAILGWDYVSAEVFEAETINGFQNALPSTTYTAPSAVQDITATTGTTTLEAYWRTPASTGNKALTGYTATLTGGGTTRAYNVSTSGTISTENGLLPGLDVKGLKPYTSYTLTVTANNDIGAGAANSKTVRTKPTAPKLGHLTVTKNKTSFAFKWKAATTTTGHITKYKVIITKGGKKIASKTLSASTRKLTVKHLRSNTNYKVSFIALNSANQGEEYVFTARTKR